MAAPAAETAGERRHVTVMFCDLVDSTGIAAKLDAEEWRDLVGAYLDAATAAVTEMGGKVAKKLGDGLMAALAARIAIDQAPWWSRCIGRSFRRRAEYRGAGAGAGRAGCGRGDGAGAAAGRRPVRRRGARQA